MSTAALIQHYWQDRTRKRQAISTDHPVNLIPAEDFHHTWIAWIIDMLFFYSSPESGLASYP